MFHDMKIAQFIIIFAVLFNLFGCSLEDITNDAMDSFYVNKPEPGLMVTAFCKDEKSKKDVRKIKYLGSVKSFVLGRDIYRYNEDLCGKQIVSKSFDVGVFACTWEIIGTSDGKEFSFHGQLKSNEQFFLGADKSWFNRKWTYLELKCS